MELIGAGTGVARQYAIHGTDLFTLIDIGCSGGIDWQWRLLQPKLRAFAFDPNVEECERLRKQEQNPNIEYISGFVGGDESENANAAPTPHIRRNPWERLSVARTREYRAALRPRPSQQEVLDENLWDQTQLAPTDKPIFLPDFFVSRRVSDIDFIKIDVDGPDFRILKSIKNVIADTNVLGIGMEVNWVGSEHPDDHTFHNTDRYLRSLGFDLFGLTMRRYSMGALPLQYALSVPAQALNGRPLQGDAVYLRDLAAPDQMSLAGKLTAQKIMKLAVLFDMFNLPDHVADLMLTYEERFGGAEAVRPILDHLAQSAGVKFEQPLSYREYMRRFALDDAAFYPVPPNTLSHGTSAAKNQQGTEPTGAVRRRIAAVRALMNSILRTKKSG